MKLFAVLMPFFFVAVSACAHSNDDAVDPLTLPAKPTGPTSACALELVKENLCASITWESEPTESTKGVFLLKFTNVAGAATAPAQAVGVKLWMPAMGHGSSPIQLAAVSAGVYRVSDVYFVMAGRWEIHVQLKNGTAVADEAIQLYDAHD